MRKTHLAGAPAASSCIADSVCPGPFVQRPPPRKQVLDRQMERRQSRTSGGVTTERPGAPKVVRNVGLSSVGSTSMSEAETAFDTDRSEAYGHSRESSLAYDSSGYSSATPSSGLDSYDAGLHHQRRPALPVLPRARAGRPRSSVRDGVGVEESAGQTARERAFEEVAEHYHRRAFNHGVQGHTAPLAATIKKHPTSAHPRDEQHHVARESHARSGEQLHFDQEACVRNHPLGESNRTSQLPSAYASSLNYDTPRTRAPRSPRHGPSRTQAQAQRAQEVARSSKALRCASTQTADATDDLDAESYRPRGEEASPGPSRDRQHTSSRTCRRASVMDETSPAAEPAVQANGANAPGQSSAAQQGRVVAPRTLTPGKFLGNMT
jgi:hypothetical protein